MLVNWAKKINEYSVIYSVIHNIYTRERSGSNIDNINRNNLNLFTDQEIILNIRSTLKLNQRLKQNGVWFDIPIERTSKYKDRKFKPGLIGFIKNINYNNDVCKKIYTVYVYDLGRYIGTGVWLGNNIMHYGIITKIISNS